MPSAANIIIFQLSTSKTAWYQKTQDWHFAPWAFSLLLEPVRVFEGPWKCPWGPFLESLCQLRMIVSCPADRPQTLNVNGKCCNRSEIVRLTFSADFFARNLAVNIHMGIRWNLARVGTRRWWDVLVHDEDHEAVGRVSVAVDDDPEEAVGRETVGRTRRGRKKDSRSGRVSEEFATVLEEFESAVSEPAELLRITVFILRAQRSAYRLGPFFLECWQVSLKFLRLVPIQLGRGEQVYSPTLSTRPNPTPQLTKNFVNVGANVENYFFFVCVTIVFFMETGSKLEL